MFVIGEMFSTVAIKQIKPALINSDQMGLK